MKKKYFWILSILIVVVFIAVPVLHVLKTKWNEADHKAEIPKGFADDASELSLTKVDTTIAVSKDKNKIQNQLRTILKYATEHHLKISIAGATGIFYSGAKF